MSHKTQQYFSCLSVNVNIKYKSYINSINLNQDQRRPPMSEHQYCYEQFTQAKNGRIYYKECNKNTRSATKQEIDIYRRLQLDQRELQERYPYDYSNVCQIDGKLKLVRNNEPVRVLSPHEMEIYKKEKNKQIALSEAKEGLRSVNFAEVRVNENGFGIIRINNVDEYLTKSQTTYFNLLTTKKRTTFEDFVYFFKVLEIKDRYNGEGKYGLYHFGKYMCELTVMETEYFEKNRKNLQEKEPNMLPLKSSTRKVYSPNIQLSNQAEPDLIQKEQSSSSEKMVFQSDKIEKVSVQGNFNKYKNVQTFMANDKMNEESIMQKRSEAIQKKHVAKCLKCQKLKQKARLAFEESASLKREQQNQLKVNEQLRKRFFQENQKLNTRLQVVECQNKSVQYLLQLQRDNFGYLSNQFTKFKEEAAKNLVSKIYFDELQSRFNNQKQKSHLLSEKVKNLLAQIETLHTKLSERSLVEEQGNKEDKAFKSDYENQVHKYKEKIIQLTIQNEKLQNSPKSSQEIKSLKSYFEQALGPSTSLIKNLEHKLSLKDDLITTLNTRLLDVQSKQENILNSNQKNMNELHDKFTQLNKKMEYRQNEMMSMFRSHQEKLNIIIDQSQNLRSEKEYCCQQKTEFLPSNSSRELEYIKAAKEKEQQIFQFVKKEQQFSALSVSINNHSQANQKTIMKLRIALNEKQENIKALTSRCQQNQKQIQKLRQIQNNQKATSSINESCLAIENLTKMNSSVSILSETASEKLTSEDNSDRANQIA